MNRIIITILSLAGVGCLIMAVLFYASAKDIRYTQEFVRLTPGISISKEAESELSFNDYYLAGILSDKIYLARKGQVDRIFEYDSSLIFLSEIALDIDTGATRFTKNAIIKIDSLNFIIQDGAVPCIMKGRIGYWKAEPLKLGSDYFDFAVPISNNTFVVQITAGEIGRNSPKKMLGIIKTDSSILRLAPSVLEGQIDEYFSNVGFLRYSKDLKCSVFTYAYRNQYILLDSMLSVIGSGRTIDSISKVKINPIEISEGKYTLASTAAIVNINTQVWNKLLMVHSNLMGNLEFRDIFDNGSPVDLYDLETKRYMASFYVPHLDNEKMQSFMVGENNNLLVIYGNKVVKYRIGFTKHYGRI
ncbi:hypothetical protein [Parachryseolinea silvisoli]|uniref:hypothetical protein n=1 Tax=Parachryseolinea silvisoli TaxID=2873601 RepID=UPI002265B07F|nr:hypothetical protein [Parachryseolinea silvisoli]MCD9015199.1 hypothetical protein [Parachryseolinea silvisoli]